MIKRFLTIIIIFCLSVFSAIGCGKGKSSITAAGSTAFQPFAEKLAEQYMASNPGININIQGGGSALGIQSALSGAAEIGMADLVKLPEEAQALNSIVVARDGIVIVVNLKNKVNNLMVDQIRDIYNGKITKWKELGGDNLPITVISREVGSGTRSSFETIINNISLIKDSIIQDSNGTVRETVINDANAIGYISHGLINEKIKPLTINGVTCTTENIMKGRYILVRPVYLLTKGEPGSIAKNFIEFVISPEGQETIKSSGLIPAK